MSFALQIVYIYISIWCSNNNRLSWCVCKYMYITCIHIVTWSPLWTTFQFLAKFQELPEALYDYLYDFGFLGQKEEDSYVNAMVEPIFQTAYFVRLHWTLVNGLWWSVRELKFHDTRGDTLRWKKLIRAKVLALQWVIHLQMVEWSSIAMMVYAGKDTDRQTLVSRWSPWKCKWEPHNLCTCNGLKFWMQLHHRFQSFCWHRNVSVYMMILDVAHWHMAVCGKALLFSSLCRMFQYHTPFIRDYQIVITPEWNPYGTISWGDEQP